MDYVLIEVAGRLKRCFARILDFQYKEGGSSVSAVTFLMSSEVRTVFVCTLSIQNVTNLHVNERTLSQKSCSLFGKTAIAIYLQSLSKFKFM